MLRRFLEVGEKGFYAVRTPGSGTGKTAKPDIIAVDRGELLAIEVKSSSKPYASFTPEQMARLKEFVDKFEITCPHCKGSFKPKPVAAVRFVGRGWKFLDLSKYDGAKGLLVRWKDEH